MSDRTAEELGDIIATSPISRESWNFVFDSTGRLVRNSDGSIKTTNHRIEMFYAKAPAHQVEENIWVEDGGWHQFLDILRNGPVDVAGVGTVHYEASYGGEGLGDDYYFVIKVVEEDGEVRHLKMPGYYSSYSGGSYDGSFLEVKPVERTVVFYE